MTWIAMWFSQVFTNISRNSCFMNTNSRLTKVNLECLFYTFKFLLINRRFNFFRPARKSPRFGSFSRSPWKDIQFPRFWKIFWRSSSKLPVWSILQYLIWFCVLRLLIKQTPIKVGLSRYRRFCQVKFFPGFVWKNTSICLVRV